MRRSTLGIIIVALGVASVAWSQTSGATSTLPLPTSPTNPGLVTNGGYVTSGAATTPLITTPNISLNTVATHPVGATSGTGNNVVGASSSTLNAMPAVAEGMVTTQPQILNPNLTAVNATVENAPAPATAEAINPSANMNLGVGNPLAYSAYSHPSETEQDLGKLSRYYRARRNPNVHVFTNDDIARLNQSIANTGASIIGNSQEGALPTGGVAGAATSATPSVANPAPAQPPTVAAPPSKPPL